jgi:hypothetical protein
MVGQVGLSEARAAGRQPSPSMPCARRDRASSCAAFHAMRACRAAHLRGGVWWWCVVVVIVVMMVEVSVNV